MCCASLLETVTEQSADGGLAQPTHFPIKLPRTGCPTRGGFTGGPRCRWGSGDFADTELRQNWAAFAIGVMAKAAPQPLLGLQNQTSLHRVAVHVAQLFHSFVFGKHNKIVEATLPNMSHGDGCTPKRVCLGTALGAKSSSSRWAKVCFKAASTSEGFPRSGSLKRRWTCSGITT